MNEYIIELVFSVLTCMVLPYLLFAFLRKRWKVSWIFFAIGSGSFILSQIIHIPLNSLLTEIKLLSDVATASGITLWQTAFFLGLTAGLCEELTRFAVLFLVEKVQRKSPDGVTALALGIGHGGIEAIIFGGIFAAGNIITASVLKLNDPTILQIKADQWSLIQNHYLPIINLAGGGLLPVVERIMAMMLHISLSFWVWKAYRNKKYALLIAAIAYHTLVDMVLVLTIGFKLDYWLTEGLFLILILPAAFITIHLAKQESFWNMVPPKTGKANFLPVMNHEFFYLKKSHKIWLIPLVFVLIALMSVLTAYFMPEIFKSIKEMQEYLDLIPTPTVADALGQYVKNVTQFGFIIIILVGMSAISSEKEKGTAALFLTKPISRSSFILAKSFSLMILVLSAIILSSMVAYAYINILFEPVPFGHIALINLYLFLWFLPLLGLTLIGSSIGKSTGSSAGISLALCVVLMLLGSIPMVQGLFPGSLLGIISDYNAYLDLHTIQRWAPSAIVTSISIFMLSNVLSIGLLENDDFD
jgi:ABC-2 type transport system permease protein